MRFLLRDRELEAADAIARKYGSTMALADALDAIPIVANTAERNTRFPAPQTNQRVQNLGTGAIERWNGSWVTDFQAAYALAEINVKASPYNAAGDGAANDTAAIQAALDAASALVGTGAVFGCKVRIPRGKYNVTSTLTVNQHRIHIEGDGIYATDILFNPSSAAALFKVQLANTALVIYQGSIRRLSCTGSGTQQKIAFDLWDSSEFTIEETTTNSWTGNSGSTSTPSIALRTNGREILTVRKVDWFADRPIHFRVNPNSNAIETCDHFHFTDIYIAAQVASEACILIDANCAPSNLTFDGYQAWIGGKYGLDYTAGGTTGAAGILQSFSHVRREQSADATGYAVRWQGQSTQNLSFRDCYFGGGANDNGVLLRNVARALFENCVHSGAGGSVAFDITNCDEVWRINSFSQVGSTCVITGLEEVLSFPQAGSGAPAPNSAYYCNTAGNPIRALKIGGVYRFCYKASIASGGFINLPLLTVGNGLKTATVLVSGYSATGPINEGGMAIATAGTVTRIAGTTNFDVGNVGGRLCVFYNASGNPMVLLNNTAQTLFVTVDITASYG